MKTILQEVIIKEIIKLQSNGKGSEKLIKFRWLAEEALEIISQLLQHGKFHDF